MGNGHMIPVHGHGQLSLPSSHKSLTLKNVLYTPKLIISVRKFSHDNMISIEFDPFGFSVKDMATRNIVLRSNSPSDFYPFQSTHGDTVPSSISSAFSILSSSIWHSRLGHPGNKILNSLYSSNSIQCNKTPNFRCHSCPLGKHVRLPFIDSQFIITCPFEIIHIDIWTSLVSSTLG